MFFNNKLSIPSDKIMLAKHQALAKAWGEDKQQLWGELTNIAIIMTSELIKENKFDTINQLYLHVAGMRRVIGGILGHDKEIGLTSRSESSTLIRNHPDSGYKEMYAEFKSWIENLRLLENNPNLSLNKDGLILKGSFKIREKDDPIWYFRSRIFGTDDFRLMHSKDIETLLSRANTLFIKLKLGNLTAEEKKRLIDEVYFYIADAMPCTRGAASIAQMIFYALEDSYTDEMRYLGKMGSKYGHAQGVTPDIAAMLSPSFSDFQDYLHSYVIDEGVAVLKKKPVIDGNPTQQSHLLFEEINMMLKTLKEFEKKLQFNTFHNLQKEIIQPKINACEYVVELYKKISDHPNQLGSLNIFMTKLKQSLVLNEICYPDFYALLEVKQGWPAPDFKNKNVIDVTSLDVHLETIGSLTSLISTYCENVSQLYSWKDSHHMNSHYTARDISRMSSYFRDDQKRGSLDMNQFFAASEYKIGSQKSGFGKSIDELVEMLSVIDQDKEQGVSRGETENKIYDQICNRCLKPENLSSNPYHVKYIKQVIHDIYEKSDSIKANLHFFSPFAETLKLKNKTAIDLINTPQRAAKPNKFI